MIKKKGDGIRESKSRELEKKGIRKMDLGRREPQERQRRNG
jgi:hypothetical protein